MHRIIDVDCLEAAAEGHMNWRTFAHSGNFTFGVFTYADSKPLQTQHFRFKVR